MSTDLKHSLHDECLKRIIFRIYIKYILDISTTIHEHVYIWLVSILYKLDKTFIM